jgi:hypothetical protein
VGREFLEGPLDGELRVRSEGVVDLYAGRPVLTTPQAIRSAFPAAPGVFIAIDPQQLRAGNIDPGLMPVLRSEGHELCQGRCASLLLYFWPLHRG